jgi:hypothetical protein
MEKALLNRLTALIVGLALILAFTPTMTTAQEMMRIAGEIKAVYTKQDTAAVGDTEGHKLSFAISEGPNASTAEHEFMDGAQMVNYSFGDLVGGNGPHQGYIKFTKNGDSAFAKWNGEVTTTLSTENTPVTTFEGTTTWIKGTGKFKNIQGTGTYKGAFTSKTEYAVAWAGEYTIKE